MKRLILIGIVFLITGLAIGYYFGYDIAWEKVLKEPGDELIEEETQTVKLYYYNPELDKDETGNLLCSRQGLVAVERSIPQTESPIEDTLELLLTGALTEAEQAAGITTEYPLAGLSLMEALLENGNLTLTFSDPQNQTSGGACRVGILRAQIEATAMQFEGVRSVNFQPEEFFQP